MAAEQLSALLKLFELPVADGSAESGGHAAGRGPKSGAAADALDSYSPSDGSLLGRVRPPARPAMRR